MAELPIVPSPTLDILPVASPALSSVSDMPVIETKPDASNEVKPPEHPEVPAAPESEVDEGKTEVESATAPEAEPSASDEPKKAKGVQKRLDELVRQREEAERRATEEREEKLRLLAIIEGKQDPSKETAPPADLEPVKPRPDDYPTTKDWEEALLTYADRRSEWSARKAVAAAREADQRERESERIAVGIKKTQDEYTKRLTEFKVAHQDFDEVLAASNVMVPQVAVQAIVNHPLGAQLQYHFAKNPQDAQRLLDIAQPGMTAQLVDTLQAMELGSILKGLAAPAPTSKPAVSNAPPPITPIKGAGDPPRKDPESETMEEYATRRKKELRGGRDMRH